MSRREDSVRTRELPAVALLLILASALLFWLHYAIFHDPHLIFAYGLHALAFLPIEVLVVTLIIDRLLSAREKQDRQHKMNMVIGAFYSAVGRPLLQALLDLETDRAAVAAQAAVAPDWSERQIQGAAAWARRHRFPLHSDLVGLGALRDLLAQHREFLLRLLENPILLEHEAFTELLWAVFHLEEELSARPDLQACPPSDLEHLVGDAERAYARVLAQWLDYMIHLRRSYPFLFSFAARTNPLREDARAEVT
jgi:hypothetical protein